MQAAGRDDLADDLRLQSNVGRVAHQSEVDGAIADWTRTLDAAELVERLNAAAVPVGRIYSVADMFADPHFHQRGLFEEVATPSGPLKVPAILPKLGDTPGRTEWAGPELGRHTREVLHELLGCSEDALDALAATGVI
jgi:crotonobetainyl-CoA:carnitine CoA-transferase CaiB-like acyl-CoA transferase